NESSGSFGSASRRTESRTPRSTRRSSLIARRRPPTSRDTSTRAVTPSTMTSAPTSNRPSSSLADSTTKAPSTPCGRPTRPTLTRSSPGSVGNLEDVALVGAGAARTDDAPQRPRDPSLLPDDLADVVGRDVEVEDDGVLALLLLDAYSIRLVDEPARKPLEELGHAVPQSEMPAALMSRDTGAVGWAPLDIQSLIFASSRSIVDGSVCGL